MTVFSHVLSKRLNSCDRKFLVTKKRQKRLWTQANIFWGLGKRKTFPQQHLWCSTVHDKKCLQAGILHMQSVRKESEANNLDKFFWDPLIKVCELYHEVHSVWSSFHEIKNLLYLLTLYFLINYDGRPKAWLFCENVLCVCRLEECPSINNSGYKKNAFIIQ